MATAAFACQRRNAVRVCLSSALKISSIWVASLVWPTPRVPPSGIAWTFWVSAEEPPPDEPRETGVPGLLPAVSSM